MKRPLTPAALGLLPLLIALPAHGEKPGSVVQLGQVEEQNMVNLIKGFNDVISRDVGNKWSSNPHMGFLDTARVLLQEKAAALVPSRKLIYWSRNAKNEDVKLSGRVLLPNRKRGLPPLGIPLVLYCHATETKKANVPSDLLGDEVMLGATFAASMNFAVAMPDQPGMGVDSMHMHPYCHGKALAYAVLDMVPGALNAFEGTPFKWNHKFYIMGYSEGGYTAMAAVRELSLPGNENYLSSRIPEADHQDIKLTAAACMAGPFDFKGSVQGLLKDKVTPYDRPYIPAYLLYGWQGVYGDAYKPSVALNPLLMVAKDKDLDKGNADAWFDGKATGDEITPRIQKRLQGDKTTARAVLNDQWVEDNIFGRNPQSLVPKQLKENDLYGDWNPQAPVLLVHPFKDECVPFKNSETIRETWLARNYNAMPIMRLETPPGSPAVGHVPGAVLSIPIAFHWFKAGAPRAYGEALDQKLDALFGAPEHLLKASIIKNSSAKEATLKLTGAAAIGKVLVTRASGKHEVLGYLTSLKDEMKLPAKESVEVYLIPTLKLVDLTLTVGEAPRAASLSVKKQVRSKILWDPTLSATPDAKGFIGYDEVAFEYAEKGPLFEVKSTDVN